ncbi:MAG: Gfo/Idh/MocA family oxidoreductase [Candidatus Poseidonia sp.]|nr:Gfo/Idh/MocA family oxidoreductase [Poseidonia sp.]
MTKSIGLVGCGRWGSNHLNVLQRFRAEGLIERIVVCDVDPIKLRGLEVDASYTSFKEALQRETLDAVAVVTPPDSHLSLMEQALERALPVLVEKPLSDNHDALEHTLATLHKGAQIMVGYLLRHHPGMHALRTHINAGLVGEVVSVTYVRTTRRTRPKGAEPVKTLAVHGLDIVAWLLSSPLMEMTTNAAEKHEDSAEIRLETKQGKTGVIKVGWNWEDEERRIVVAGKTGSQIMFDFGTGELTSVNLLENFGNPSSLFGSETVPYKSEALEEEWRAFLERNQSSKPYVFPPLDTLLDQSAWIEKYG